MNPCLIPNLPLLHSAGDGGMESSRSLREWDRLSGKAILSSSRGHRLLVRASWLGCCKFFFSSLIRQSPASRLRESAASFCLRSAVRWWYQGKPGALLLPAYNFILTVYCNRGMLRSSYMAEISEEKGPLIERKKLSTCKNSRADRPCCFGTAERRNSGRIPRIGWQHGITGQDL